MNKSLYKEALSSFCEEVAPCYNCGYPYGPFVPYVFSSYEEAPVKIFYMGRDTYYWVEKDVLFSAYKEGNLEKYLERNDRCVDVDKILKWSNNAGAFWTLVAKVHLAIRTGRYYSDVTVVGNKEKNILAEIGYGNTNAIELPKSLQQEGVWEEIMPQEDYWKIRTAGQRLEKLKLILDTYRPDCIFIFNWEDKDDIFDGLDVEWHKEYYERNFRAVYTIDGYDTKIIWSSHPRRYSFLQTNMEEMVSYLVDSYKELGFK